MKKAIIILFTLFSLSTYSQKITKENYYDYLILKPRKVKGNNLITKWLTKFDIVKVLEDEMQNACFEQISTFSIVKLNENEFISSICFSEKSNVGFLLEESHYVIPKKENRTVKSIYKEITGNDYSEKIVKADGSSYFLKIKEIPNNFYLLKIAPYWYQYTDNPRDNNILVTKEIIMDILRKDIVEIIAGFKE
ncbi:hypothetical protein [Flectobacillus rivi]|uniref:DUF4468 domain-containing protein n=1 Tax=Flectobacillus rivi TaxID=2984209 RepID=A0ABT6YVV2_9BACT|nr:hypothetical protein [Flectobacillus rivi]MDI9872939.1 hypothetical protein [Flectobacillus rivi]